MFYFVIKIQFVGYALVFTDFKNMKPTTPDRIEAVKIANFASETWSTSLKESRAIKIDMVKPIPASMPKPKMCFQPAPVGKSAHFSFTASQLKKVTPIVYPTNKPKIMPRPRGETSPVSISFWKAILVLASAKSGIMR